MLRIGKIVFFIWFLSGCSVLSINLFKSSMISQLPVPPADSGYANLHTRVISSKQEYKAFLGAIDAQRHWEHKLAFAMQIAKNPIDFEKENLLIYRHSSQHADKILSSRLVSVSDTGMVIELDERNSTMPLHGVQLFFYKVSKKLPKVLFKSKKRTVTVKNSNRQVSVVPRECIAWFDGCNHCIRSSTGKTLCTKRYCKKKGAFSCVKWQ